MVSDDEGWTKVGAAIEARLADLGWDQVDLVRASGVSDATVRRLQRGEPGTYRRSTLRQVGQALGWSIDGIDRIRSGEDPGSVATGTVAAPTELAALHGKLDRLSAEDRAAVEQLVDRLLDE